MITKNVSLALCFACMGLVVFAQDGAQTKTKKKAPKVETTKFMPPKIVKDEEVAPPPPPKEPRKPAKSKAKVPPPPPPPPKKA